VDTDALGRSMKSTFIGVSLTNQKDSEAISKVAKSPNQEQSTLSSAIEKISQAQQKKP
jgi:hypothetical protein